MKNTKFSDSQIMNILKEAQNGLPVAQICRKYGIGNSTFYKWRSKYGGMDAAMISEMKALKAENNRLKRMYADVQLQNEIVQEALRKKW